MFNRLFFATCATLVPFSAFAATAEVPTGTFKLGKCEVTVTRAAGEDSFEVKVLTPTFRNTDESNWAWNYDPIGVERVNYDYDRHKNGFWGSYSYPPYSPRFAAKSGYKLEKAQKALFSGAKTLVLLNSELETRFGTPTKKETRVWLYLNSSGQPKRAYAWYHMTWNNSHPTVKITYHSHDWVDCK